MLKEIIAVFIGGGIGSVLRFLLNKIEIVSENNYPYSTFISNVVGCFILGLVLGYFIKNDSNNSILFVFLTVGLCGGFTTFSSFSNENLQLLQNGHILSFLIYTLLSLILGIMFVYFATIFYKNM